MTCDSDNKGAIEAVAKAMAQHDRDREGNPWWYDQLAVAAIKAYREWKKR